MDEIVVVGSCMIDSTCYVPRFPNIGETIKCYRYTNSFGGKGANQAVAASKLGSRVAMVGRVGDDDWGYLTVENFRKYKINANHVAITKNTRTGMAHIVVNEAGENSIVLNTGANDLLTPSDLMDAHYLLHQAQVLVVQLETSVEIAMDALQSCPEKTITILNATPVPEYRIVSLLSMATYVVVNAVEAIAICNHAHVDLLRSEGDVFGGAKSAAQKMVELGAKHVIVTLGADGAIYADSAGQILHIKAPKVTVLDTIGAGDAFVGALAHLLLRSAHSNTPILSKRNIETILQICCNLASESVRLMGTQSSYVGRDEAEEMIKDLLFGEN